MKNKMTFNRFFYNNKALMAFSLIISIFFWTQLKFANGNVISKKIYVIANLSTVGSSASPLSPIGDPHYSICVVVYGPLNGISKLKAEDISVTPKFGQVTGPGQYDSLPLSKPVITNSQIDNVKVDTYSPQTVSVYYDKIETKTFDVKIDSSDLKPASDLVLGETGFTDANGSKLTVTGPQTRVDEIVNVKAVTAPATLSETTSTDAAIKLYDASNSEMDAAKNYFTLSNDTVNVTTNVLKKGNLQVVPTFDNMPAYFSSHPELITSSVTSVNVLGPVNGSWTVSSLPTDTMDFDTVSLANKVLTTNITLPSDITVDPANQSQLTGVKVNVNLAGFKNKSMDISNIQPQNLQSGLTFAAKTITGVNVIGLNSSISKIGVGDLTGFVDLSKITSPGSYTLPVQFKCSKYSDVWASNPLTGQYQVIVEIN